MQALARIAEVAVFVTDPRYPPLAAAGPRVFERRAKGRPLPVPGASVEHVPYPLLPVITRAINGRVLGWRLLLRVREFRPDLILGYFVHPEGTAAVQVARRIDVPAVVCAIGSDLCRIPGVFSRRVTCATLRRASLVIAVSEDVRRRAVALGAPPERTVRVLNGCDGALFHVSDREAARRALGLPAAARLILFAGNLVEVKGVRDLLAAFDILSADMRVMLAVVGSGPLAAEAGALRERHPGRVLVPGPRPAEEIARWIAACDVVCLPSYSEGCPNVVLEALTSGRPVVASAVGGVPELVNETNGALVQPGDPSGLAAALVAAMNRSWDPEAIARQGGRTWNDVARDTLAACSRLLPQAFTEAA